MQAATKEHAFCENSASGRGSDAKGERAAGKADETEGQFGIL